MQRHLHYVANQAVSRPPDLDDLPGQGRWDLLCRTVMASMMKSHGLRRDTTLTMYLDGPPNPGLAIRVTKRIRRLHPGERPVAALLGKALAKPAFPVFQEVLPGIEIGTAKPEEEVPDGAFILDPKGEDLHQLLAEEVNARDAPAEWHFVIGDHQGLSSNLVWALQKRAGQKGSIGPEAIHADHAIAVLHNIIDRA